MRNVNVTELRTSNPKLRTSPEAKSMTAPSLLGLLVIHTDSKVHGANMGPTWGRQDPGGPHVGHMNLAIWAWTVTEIQDDGFWHEQYPDDCLITMLLLHKHSYYKYDISSLLVWKNFETTLDWPVIRDAMTVMWRPCNVTHWRINITPTNFENSAVVSLLNNVKTRAVKFVIKVYTHLFREPHLKVWFATYAPSLDVFLEWHENWWDFVGHFKNI